MPRKKFRSFSLISSIKSVKLAKETVVKRDDNSDSSKKVYNAHAILFPYGGAYIQISQFIASQ